MKTTIAVAAFLLAGCAAPVRPPVAGGGGLDAASRRALALDVVGGWSENSRLAARTLLDRYGAPDEVGSSALTWNGNGPWKRTIVRDVPRPYAGAAGEDLGVIEQTVTYVLTPEQAYGLAPLGDRLSCDPAAGELSSRSDREAVNVLRLNLAADVLTKTLSPQEAADSYARFLALESSGKTVKYMLGLSFGRAPSSKTTP